jgi:dTDP-4-dehydrorhamnose 3,5-epimerase
MEIEKTPINDLLVLKPKVFTDNRGYFFESFRQSEFGNSFVQDNESFSSKGTLRGLHLQNPPQAQAKLVRVINGKIFDVAVDLRKKSPTYKKWFGLILDDHEKKQLLVPRGFAHGFLVLSETATVCYKCDAYYSKADEVGFLYNDSTINIEWPKLDVAYELSEKDGKAPSFLQVEDKICF